MLEAISCDQMLELAAHGAKVLHPGCVEIARRTGIALYARATAKRGGGTRIDMVGAGADVDAVGVAGMKGLVRVRTRGEGCVRRLLDAVADAEIPALHLDTDMDSADLWFSLQDVPDWQEIRRRLEEQLELEVLDGVGAVSVVGDRIGADIARLHRLESLCEQQEVEIAAISSSPLRVTLFCREGAVDGLTRAIHAQLIERVHRE
jgi:aspartate kinase